MNIRRSDRPPRKTLQHGGPVSVAVDGQHRRPIPLSLRSLFCTVGVTVWLLTGCAESPPASQAPVGSTTSADEQQQAPAANGAAASVGEQSTAMAEAPVEFKPLTLSAIETPPASATSAATGLSADDQIRTIISRLQPLQILLGQWRGTTRREFENFKAVDNHEWVWDLRTSPAQPALVIRSDKSPYLRAGRLTWDTQQNCFVLSATDGEGKERRLTGDFSEAPHEVTGSDDKQHRVFRLELNEERAGQEGEQWQLAFAQQENNRYLLELGKRRGMATFARYDTVSTQREGTSFALSDTGYAERTCIISEGLGTTELTWKGRSYWVCCSGCKAAFEEDPERWIALAAERSREKP